MRRFDMFTVVLLAALAGACGGESGDVASPTSPTQTTTTTTTTPPPPTSACARPPAPGNLAVTASGSRVTLDWTAVSGANQYFVMVGTSPSSSNVIFTNTTQTSFNWNGGSRGTYYARVAANNACGDSVPSNEVTIVIP